MILNLRRRLTIIFASLSGLILAIAITISFIMASQQNVAQNELKYQMSMYRLLNYLASVGTPSAEWLTSFEREEGFVVQVSAYEHGANKSEEIPFPQGTTTKTPRAELLGKVEKDINEMFFVSVEDAGVLGSLASYQSGVEAYSIQFSAAVATMPHTDDFVMEGVLNGAPESAEIVSNLSNVAMASFPMIENSARISGQHGDKYRAAAFSYPGLYNSYEIVVIEDLAQNRADYMILIVFYAMLLLFGLAMLIALSRFLAKSILRSTEEGIQRQADFVAAASHELRSPLAVVKSSLSAADVAPTQQRAQKYRANAEAEVDRMGRLIEDLLLLAGGDAGSWNLHQDKMDVDTLLIEASEQFAPLFKKAGIKLVLCLPSETLPTLNADKERVYQALAAILHNAIQYAPKDTQVTLEARTKKGRVEIDIADSGPGIPDEEKPRVFERFYRAERSRTTKAHFGLGLAVAKELVEINKGTLTLHSTKGGGATFRLSFPVG